MSQTLNINNYGQTNLLQQTRLNAVLPADSATVGVQNNADYGIDDYFVIGTLGGETTELCKVSSITGVNIITPVAHTTQEHVAYDYVNKLYGNQLRIYRASNDTGLQPADADFTLLDTVDIQADRAYTQYTDPSGSADYWYKFTYYNSTTDSESSLADSRAVRGGSSGDYCSVEGIREEAGFTYAPYITDPMIDAKRQAAQDEINGTLHGFYPVPFAQPINPFIADICKRLAAGLLLVEQYSAISANNTANGDSKIKMARADLQALATKQKVLVDTAGSSMAEAGSTGGVSGWPNADTASGQRSSGGAPRQFRMGDIGTTASGRPGYSNRKY